MGTGARPPRRGARRTDCQCSRRRNFGRPRCFKAPFALRGLLHGRSDCGRCGVQSRTRPWHPRAPVHLPVPRDAALFAARCRVSRRSWKRQRGTRGPRCSSIAARCRSAFGRSWVWRAASTCGTEIRSMCTRWPRNIRGVPFIIPHFGAGLFREALLVADLCPNVYLDTSSTNRWMAYHPSLTLTDVFRQALQVVGPDRLLFGTDSSFFPRGWNRQIYDTQVSALAIRRRRRERAPTYFRGNFDTIVSRGPVVSGSSRTCSARRPLADALIACFGAKLGLIQGGTCFTNSRPRATAPS